MWILLILVTVLSAVLLRWLYRIQKLRNQLSWIPGPPTVPIFGNALSLYGLSHSEIFTLLCNWTDEYGDIFIIWVMHQPMISVSSVFWMKELMNSTKDSKKSIQYDFLDNFIGKGLLSSYGEDWYHRRKVLTPCFHFEILNNFIQPMDSHSKKLIGILKVKADSGKPFDVIQLSKQFALDVVMDTTMGVNVNALDSPDTSYVQSIDTMNSLIIIRSFTMLYDNDFIYGLSKHKKIQDKCRVELRNFSSEIIKKRKNERKIMNGNVKNSAQDKNRLALLDLLLTLQENGAELSDQQIEEEINTFIFAGHDTTAAAISFTLYCLGRNQSAQNCAAEEVRSKLPHLMSTCLSMKDLGQLEYLERCIKESLRLYPPVPTVGKTLLKPLVTEKGTIPADIDIALEIYSLHRNPELFENTLEFNPDRFLKYKEEQMDPFTFVPFSAGARNCIGQKFAMMEMKMVLSHILFNYEIEAIDKPEDLKLMSHIVLACEGGIKLRLRERR